VIICSGPLVGYSANPKPLPDVLPAHWWILIVVSGDF
jgi:hypothetical protein